MNDSFSPSVSEGLKDGLRDFSGGADLSLGISKAGAILSPCSVPLKAAMALMKRRMVQDVMGLKSIFFNGDRRFVFVVASVAKIKLWGRVDGCVGQKDG